MSRHSRQLLSREGKGPSRRALNNVLMTKISHGECVHFDRSANHQMSMRRLSIARPHQA